MNLQVTPHKTIADPRDEKPARSAVPLLVGGVLLIAVLGGYYYYTHMSDGGAARAGRNAAAPVKVALVEKRDMQVIEHTLGTVVANSVVSVTARVQGQLTAVHFKEGQVVRKGSD